MTLTEQMINGVLPDGLYWCKKFQKYGEPNIEMVGIAGSYLPTHYEEILAPVPSYEEWQALQQQLEIAREALKWFIREDMDGDVELDLIQNGCEKAQEALKKMDELKGGSMSEDIEWADVSVVCGHKYILDASSFLGLTIKVYDDSEINRLREIILRKDEALKFYAEVGHIDTNLPDSDDYILMKRLYFSAAIETGQKAREALKIGEK